VTPRVRLVVIVAGVLVALGAAASTTRVGAPRATVGEATITERVLVAAVINPVEGVAEVRPRAEGKVVRVHVREGDTVVAGQLLAEIEADTQAAEARRRTADVVAATAAARGVAAGARTEERVAAEAEAKAMREEVALLKDKLLRIEKLAAQGSASEAALTEARQSTLVAEAKLEATEARLKLTAAGGRSEDVTAARARVGSAEAALASAQIDIDRARLVAPVAGVVLARRVDPGDTATFGLGVPAAFDIADPSRTEVRLEAEESDIDALVNGAVARLVRQGAGAEVGTATISRQGERMERRTIGADDARVRADGLVRAAWATWNAPMRLPIGLKLDAWIERPPKKVAMALPRAAITVRDGAAFVEEPFLLWTRHRTVELGIADERMVEVKGLAAGSVVVLH
jgi:multidrug efflux pump subunit AcrA (membrane-fusion protein)